MKVLFVCNNAYMKGNGLCSAVVALRTRLIHSGIDVRILACENPDKQGPQPDYPQEHFVFPIFEPIVRKNGFPFWSLPISGALTFSTGISFLSMRGSRY